jgi:capsular polysaccharide export protein
VHQCDSVIVDTQMGDLLQSIDEVHCLTSLAGFEALLQGKKVTCYGQPFYSGWGFTDNKVPVTRRVRRLLLDELVAGALIFYPLYMNRRCDLLISPEEALDELNEWNAKYGGKTTWWSHALRPLFRCIVGVR